MLEKIEITGNNYKPDTDFKKYCQKRIGKLDRYLPREYKKDVIGRIVVTEVNRAHGNKFEISVAMEIPGGKVVAARDECSNVYAGIDMLEAKLMGQIRRLKTELSAKRKRRGLKRIFRKSK